MNDMTMPAYMRDPRSKRNWQLADFHEPEQHEIEFVNLAKTISPDAWEIRPMHFLRLRSLEAAARIQTREAVKAAMQEALTPPRRKHPFSHFFERIFA